MVPLSPICSPSIAQSQKYIFMWRCNGVLSIEWGVVYNSNMFTTCIVIVCNLIPDGAIATYYMQKMHEHAESDGVWNRAEAGMQAKCASNKSASVQFQQKQSKQSASSPFWVCGQRESIWESIIKFEHEINKSCSKIERSHSWLKTGQKTTYRAKVRNPTPSSEFTF